MSRPINKLLILILAFALSVCPLTSLSQSTKGGKDLTLHGQVIAFRLVNEPKQPHLMDPNGLIFMVDVLLVRLTKKHVKSSSGSDYIIVWSPYRADSSREFENGKSLKFRLRRAPGCDDHRSITKDSVDFPSFVDKKTLPLGKKLPCYLAVAKYEG